MKHKDSYMRCLVAHFDSDGRLLPACVKCSECGEWLRPEEFASGECLPTKHAPDVVVSAASASISPASEVSASEADSSPVTTQVM